jgi:hypothetical protein
MTPTMTHRATCTSATPTNLTLAMLLSLLALLLSCGTVQRPDGGTNTGISVEKATTSLTRAEAVLVDLRNAAQNAGALTLEADRYVAALIDAVHALNALTARADVGGDGIVGGTDAQGISEWLLYSTSVAIDLATRISLLGTIDQPPPSPAPTSAGAPGAPPATGAAISKPTVKPAKGRK